MADLKAEHLKKNGWFQWYHENYWCHPTKTKPFSYSDPTNWGVSLEKAYELETK